MSKTETCKRLLSCGEKLIAEKGYANTSVEDITKKANVAKGTFYTYFDSKGTFLKNLIEERLEKLTEETRVTDYANLSFREFLEKRTMNFYEYSEKDKGFLKLIMELKYDNDVVSKDFDILLNKIFDKSMDELYDIFEYFVEKENIKIKCTGGIYELLLHYVFLNNFYVYRWILHTSGAPEGIYFSKMFEEKEKSGISIQEELKNFADMFLGGVIVSSDTGEYNVDV